MYEVKTTSWWKSVRSHQRDLQYKHIFWPWIWLLFYFSVVFHWRLGSLGFDPVFAFECLCHHIVEKSFSLSFQPEKKMQILYNMWNKWNWHSKLSSFYHFFHLESTSTSKFNHLHQVLHFQFSSSVWNSHTQSLKEGGKEGSVQGKQETDLYWTQVDPGVIRTTACFTHSLQMGPKAKWSSFKGCTGKSHQHTRENKLKMCFTHPLSGLQVTW